MNRKQKDINVRKLTRMGTASLGITLPREYLTKLGWKEKQKLKVLFKGRSLILRDWK